MQVLRAHRNVAYFPLLGSHHSRILSSDVLLGCATVRAIYRSSVQLQMLGLSCADIWDVMERLGQRCLELYGTLCRRNRGLMALTISLKIAYNTQCCAQYGSQSRLQALQEYFLYSSRRCCKNEMMPSHQRRDLLTSVIVGRYRIPIAIMRDIWGRSSLFEVTICCQVHWQAIPLRLVLAVEAS